MIGDDATVAARAPATYLGVGYTLLGGLLISIAVMIAGLGLTAAQGHSAVHVLPLDRVLTRLFRGDGPALLDTGILLLFAAPLAAVIVAIGGFVLERDVVSALTTTLLMVLLIIGFVVALH
ncbi:MAG: DUF1634 domain-containing protein [Chloroflexota bacterium]